MVVVVAGVLQFAGIARNEVAMSVNINATTRSLLLSNSCRRFLSRMPIFQAKPTLNYPFEKGPSRHVFVRACAAPLSER